MNPKLSHLIRAGAVVHTVSGQVFRVTSKIASSEGINFRLANLQGKPVPTPADFRPISPTHARFAAWMRLAYNKDFDMYVKEYINAAGLPVDQTMNWSRFFAARIVPKLMSKDPEIQDEAVHQIIIKTLIERNVLANFEVAIQKFPQEIQELPLEKQVTKYLMQVFNWRISEANDYIKSDIFQDRTNSMWAEGEEEGEEVNLLDNVEYNNGVPEEFDAVDADTDVRMFRKGFVKFLDDKFREETVAQYLSLFDLLYAHLRDGDLPRGSEIFSEWKEGVGAGKSNSWFKVLFANLPKVIDLFISKYLKEEHVGPYIDIMRQIGQEREKPELQPVMGGLKLADEFPINHNIEPDQPSSGSGNSGGGGGLPSLGDAGDAAGEAGGEAAGLGSELAELAPLAIAASAKGAAQWEVPKCKACGKSQEVTDCLACHEKFCGDCKLNHHANNPSHGAQSADRIASKKAMDSEDRAFREMDTALDMKNIIEDVIGSGLYSAQGEHYFDWDGCDYCKNSPEVAKGHQGGQGADVTNYKGYRNLEDAKAPNREEHEYDFKLCDDCHNKLYYGDFS